MNFVLGIMEFSLAGFFVGLGFWFACVSVAWSCGLLKILR